MRLIQLGAMKKSLIKITRSFYRSISILLHSSRKETVVCCFRTFYSFACQSLRNENSSFAGETHFALQSQDETENENGTTSFKFIEKCRSRLEMSLQNYQLSEKIECEFYIRL